MNIRWCLESCDVQDPDFSARWDALNRLYNRGHPILDSRFIRTLVEYYPRPLTQLAGYHDDHAIALLLLEQSHKGIVHSYNPSQIQLLPALLPANTTILWPSLIRSFDWRTQRLDLYAVDPTYHQSMISAAGISSERSAGASNICIQVTGPFEDYWAERPRKLRQNMERYQKRLEADRVRVRLEILEEPTQMRRAVARYGMLESQGWKGRNGTALHPANTLGQFYALLLERFSTSGNALVAELYIGSRLVASCLCIHTTSTLITLKTTYDEAFKKYAVGRLLLQSLIEEVHRRRLSDVINFYTNTNLDLETWATHRREQFNLFIYRPGTAPLARSLFRLRKQLLVGAHR